MKTISVDTNEVSGAVRGIKTQIDTIEDICRYMSGKAASELEPIWAGPAKDAFVAELTGFVENFESFVKSCSELNDALDKARGYYDAAEQTALQKIAALPR